MHYLLFQNPFYQGEKMLQTSLKRIFLIALIALLLMGNMTGISKGQKDESGGNAAPKQAIQNPNRGITRLEKEDEKYNCPEYASLAINYFTKIGISAYFDLNKKVPKWWDDYLKSGIPMMIPNDYVTGKLYHKVKDIDLKDTSGFAYNYKNAQECSFEFVFKDPKTGENFSREIKITQKPRPGRFYEFNISKRDYTINFLSTYAKIYALKHDGKAPKNLREMLKGEGKLIEAGWKWTTSPNSNAYFEWGMDTSKCRQYFITEKLSRSETHVGDVGSSMIDSGGNHWTFKQGEKIPADVCVKTKFISSDGLYSFFKSFK